MNTTDFSKPENKGQEEVDGVKCWKIIGNAKFGDTKVTLWIDGEGLVRKIYNERIVDPAKMPASTSAAIPKTPVFTTYTAMTFKPFINEADVDKSKFAKEEK